MRILHIGDIAFVGSTLARELRKRNHETIVLSKQGGPLRDLREGWIHYRKNWLDELNLCGVDLDQYDLIHVHYLINWGSLGLSFKSAKRPVILHCHGADIYPSTPLHKLIQRFVARQGKFLLYSTPDLLKGIGWFKGRSIYLPNPVEVPNADRATGTYNDRILIFGTSYRFKMTDAIFPFLAKLPFQFDMIDFGPDRAYFRKRAPANVRFINAFPKSEVLNELSKYPLVIGASQDGSIRVCELEAMSLGIPTLFPFKYNEFYPQALPMPSEWSNDMARYLGDRTLGEKQKQWVFKHHRVETVVDQLLQIYERCLAQDE